MDILRHGRKCSVLSQYVLVFFLFWGQLSGYLRKLSTILLFAVATALFFAVVAYTFRDVDIVAFLRHATLIDTATLMALGLAFHLSFGIIMWVGFWLHYDLKLKLSEILFLPLMMHLFLYVMPMKGGMLFQVLYSKQKYRIDLSKGFSLGMTVFLNSLVLTILLGLALIYLIPVDSLHLKITIWVMGAGLAGFLIGLHFLPSQAVKDSSLLKRLLNFFINVRIQLAEQFRNVQLFFGLLIATFFSVLIQAVWFWKTGDVLGISSHFPSVLLVVLVLRIVLLFRLIPGNLGIQEVVIGVVFAAAGFQIEDGLLIGVITRLISVFWSATIGLPGLYLNLKYFRSDSLSGLIKKVAGSNT